MDCPYLIAAHRWEAEHRKPLTREEFPYPDIEVPLELVYERWQVVTGLANAILRFQVQNKELTDGTAFDALEALAETYRTLGSGIYYEKPPNVPIARALYGQLGQFVQDFRKEEANRSGFSSLKESDIFRLLVFLLRVAKQETNGRPRSRAFLGFLRARFPLPADEIKEAPRVTLS